MKPLLVKEFSDNYTAKRARKNPVILVINIST